MTYRDKTFCASPQCENKCGRKIQRHELNEAKCHGIHISYAYFCGEPITENLPIDNELVTNENE